MGLTRAQSRAWAKGTTAAIQRKKDQEYQVLDIALPPHLNAYLLIEIIKAALYRPGGLNPAISPIRVVPDREKTRLIRTQRKLRQAQARIASLLDEVAAVHRQPLAAVPLRAVGETWVSIAAAAKSNRVAYMTIYRAMEEGRIKSRSEWVNTQQRHLVVAETFVKGKRKPRTPRTKTS